MSEELEAANFPDRKLEDNECIVELGILLDTRLPDQLVGTAGHIMVQQYTPIVRVRKGNHDRGYAFRGVVTQTEWDNEPDGVLGPLIRPGMIAVSTTKMFGYDDHLRFFPAECVSKL